MQNVCLTSILSSNGCGISRKPRCLSISGGTCAKWKTYELFFFQCKYFTRLLNSESHIQIALSTVLSDLGVTVRNTGKFSGIFLCTILFPVKYSSRILKDSDSRPNSLLKFMSFLTGKLSNTMLAIQARCRGGTDSTL